MTINIIKTFAFPLANFIYYTWILGLDLDENSFDYSILVDVLMTLPGLIWIPVYFAAAIIPEYLRLSCLFTG